MTLGRLTEGRGRKDGLSLLTDKCCSCDLQRKEKTRMLLSQLREMLKEKEKKTILLQLSFSQKKKCIFIFYKEGLTCRCLTRLSAAANFSHHVAAAAAAAVRCSRSIRRVFLLGRNVESSS